MSGIFEQATRAAIQELIRNHAQESKFGFVLSEDGFERLTGDLYQLLQTSRTLKSAGDRILRGASAATPTVTSARPRPR